ncbi:hypothetical protein GIB67_038983 [Kingdonia uniflora]|uniref:D-isomer specific 2-hydroxyacid dehydrogenase NAD-binding domain-containing protein n=1 Tax=Kingdonia uniflora TaxID=39325 RepID=A0A7J7P6V1_9MAGN|nr:hypothetical protein GIB67_038983 [Kingdonia uniflora]
MRTDLYDGWLPHLFVGNLLKGDTVGVTGAGRIGSAYARMMIEGFKINLIYYDFVPSNSSGKVCDRTNTDDTLEFPMCEFTIPGTQNITVLVVGVTIRIGRIVVCILMLRGYNVKALVRKAKEEVVDMLPRSVDIVTGDVGEPLTLKYAVEEEPDASIPSIIDGLLRVHKRTVDSLDADLSNAPTPLSFLKGEGTTLPKLAIPSRTPIQIRETLNGGITLAGVTEPEFRTKEEMATYLSRGPLVRAIGSTNINSQSRCVLHPY